METSPHEYSLQHQRSYTLTHARYVRVEPTRTHATSTVACATHVIGLCKHQDAKARSHSDHEHDRPPSTFLEQADLVEEKLLSYISIDAEAACWVIHMQCQCLRDFRLLSSDVYDWQFKMGSCLLRTPAKLSGNMHRDTTY
eukprot:2612638-Pleurochrysis_carterae.AAC.3